MLWLKKIWCVFNVTLIALIPIADLCAKYHIWQAFFYAGVNKYQSWDTTLYLFEHEYSVPILPYELAALLGTTVELLFPILLLIGLGGRVPAFVLFMFNIMAVISYPVLFTDENSAGLNDHIQWGIILLLLMAHGSSKISVDHLICKFIKKEAKDAKANN